MSLLKINPEKETKRIVQFLRDTFRKQHIQNVVIGLSGGIDSMVSYFLLKETLPIKNIYPIHLPYDRTSDYIPKNIPVISIKKSVDEIRKTLIIENRKWRMEFEDRKLKIDNNSGNPTSTLNPQNRSSIIDPLSSNSRIRLGNIIARVRMIILFDLAKKNNALVCGTENKSEHLLGYFTRFGDAASDIEPIVHLYKTQVQQLAQYLGVPKDIINQHPTAGLWSGQTDEKEFGFMYEEADQVLFLYFDKKISTEKIIKMDYPHAKEIIAFVKKNEFKGKTPYYV